MIKINFSFPVIRHDQMGIAKAFGIGEGNEKATFRWNHVLNDRLLSNTSLIFSTTIIKLFTPPSTTGDLNITSDIRDYNIKT